MLLPARLSDLPRTELEALLVGLLGELAELKRLVAAQRDEIARLKGLKGRPSIKPSGMENATEANPEAKRAKRRGRGKVTPRRVRSSRATSRIRCRTWCSPRGWCAIDASAG